MTNFKSNLILALAFVFSNFLFSQFIHPHFNVKVPPDNYTLIFEDEFDDGNLNGTHWWVLGDCVQHDPFGHGNGCCENNFYMLDNVIEEDGKLKILAKRELSGCTFNDRHEDCTEEDPISCEGELMEYTSGWVETGSAEWLYGYYEITCKIPEGKGFWPAFWFLGPGAREIDVFEFCGDNTSVSQFTIHNWDQKGSRQRNHDHWTSPAHSKFMTFGLHWTPQVVQFYFNRQPGQAFLHNNYNVPMRLLLNLAVGGCFEVCKYTEGCKVDCTTPSEGLFEIEYVKVWQDIDTRNFEIIGPDEICLNDLEKYTITATQGASYNWSSTNGLNITDSGPESGSNGRVIFATVEGVGLGTQILTVDIEYSTGLLERVTKIINVIENIPSDPSQIILNFDPITCIYSLSTPPIQGATSYTWNIDGIVYNTSTNETPEFIYGLFRGRHNTISVSVTANNICGSSNVYTTSIAFPDDPPCSFTGRMRLINNPQNHNLSVTLLKTDDSEFSDEEVEGGILKVIDNFENVIFEEQITQNNFVVDFEQVLGGDYIILFENESVFLFEHYTFLSSPPITPIILIEHDDEEGCQFRLSVPTTENVVAYNWEIDGINYTTQSNTFPHSFPHSSQVTASVSIESTECKDSPIVTQNIQFPSATAPELCSHTLSLFISPNPSNNEIIVSLVDHDNNIIEEAEFSSGTLLVMNSVGFVVFEIPITSNSFQLDISSLPDGFYTVVFNSENGQYASSLVKE